MLIGEVDSRLACGCGKAVEIRFRAIQNRFRTPIGGRDYGRKFVAADGVDVQTLPSRIG